MPYWTLNRPPYWFPNAVATPQGWVNPETGEVLVTIRDLNVKAGPADILVAAAADKYKIRLEFEKTAVYFRMGDTAKIQIRLNEVVTVSGGPQIPFHVGDDVTTRYFVYEGGSGTNVLYFAYTIDSPLTGNVILNAYNIDLNGGTITDSDGTVLDSLTFPSLSTLLEFDSVIPQVAEISPTTISGPLVAGDNIDFTITFNREVKIIGTPRIPITIGENTRYADCLDPLKPAPMISNGLNRKPKEEYLFRYVIADNDVADIGEVVVADAIDINSAVIYDYADNHPETLPLPPVDTTHLYVNTDLPQFEIQSVTITDGDVGVGSNIDISLHFKIAVYISGGTPRIPLSVNGVGRRAFYLDGSGTDTIRFRYTVTPLDPLGPVTLLSPLGLFGATISNVYGGGISSLVIQYPGYSINIRIMVHASDSMTVGSNEASSVVVS